MLSDAAIVAVDVPGKKVRGDVIVTVVAASRSLAADASERGVYVSLARLLGPDALFSCRPLWQTIPDHVVPAYFLVPFFNTEAGGEQSSLVTM